MENKTRYLLIFLTLALLFSGVVVNDRAGASSGPVIGPYTEIQLPLEALPALNEELAYNPVIDQYPSGATLQVLYVLEDPRDVPLARFAYNSEDFGVIAPTNMPAEWSSPEAAAASAELLSYSPKTINVYVRVQAPEDEQVPDPLLFAQNIDPDDGYFHGHRYNKDRPALFTIPLFLDLEELKNFPCAATEYADGTSPYKLPEGIDGRDAVGKDGLYDPKAYAPPQPWYYNSNEMLEPGEVREGWISCLAPDLPFEELEIRAWYHYIRPPEPTPTPGPSPTPRGEPEDECVVVDSYDDPACQEASCCMVLLVETDPTTEALWNETPDAADLALQATYEAEKYLHQDAVEIITTWTYSVVKSVPEDGIRLDDVSLTFINEKDEKKTAQGSVIFHDPKIVRSDDGYRYYAFMSRVEVEPAGFSEEDLQGYMLSEVGAYVDVFVEHEDTFFSWHSHPDRNLSVDVGFVQPDNPYEGFLFTGIDETSFVWTAKQNTLSSTLPDIAMIRIFPLQEKTDPSFRTKDLYLARAEDFFYYDFESSTNMCEFVGCLDVKDPKDEQAVFRTVPMLCAGEWANNFIIEGVDIRVLDRIGEPYGLRDTSSPALFRYYSEDARLFTYRFRVWLYSGRIMGGVTPWWSKDIKNNKDIRDLDGYIVDLRSGLFLEERTLTLPYYQEIDKGYYVSVLYNQHESGWMAGIVDQKLLIYGPIGEIEEEYGDHTEENTGYMFMDEGPIWITSCQRDLLSTLADQERYAPAEITGASNFEGSQHEMAAMLPGMVYPVSQPRITGEILSFGEAGDPMSGYVITPEEVKVVPGKPNKPVVYVPSEDKYYPATENVNFNNELFFSKVGAIVIPPDSSFIMIEFKAELPIADVETRCKISGSDFQLSYPGYFPISSIPAWGMIRGWSCRGEDYKSWLYFMFPSLDFDPEDMLFSARGAGLESWNFWKLTGE